jgi:hypothetical protein
MSVPRGGRASSLPSRPLSETASVKPAAYQRALDQSFREACEKAGLVEIHGRLAHWDLNLRFAGEAIHDALGPAFSHLKAPGPDSPGERLTICIWDGGSSGATLAEAPWAPEDVRELGQVRGYNDARYGTTFDAYYGAITLADRETNTAHFQIPDAASAAWYERAAPLRAALRALTSSRGSDLVHAGGIGVEGEGVVVAGRSGSGKSTLAAAALASGLELVGDDYVLLTTEPDLAAYSVHSSIKLSDETLEQLPELSPGLVIASAGPGFKNVVDPEAVHPGQLVESLRIRGIVLPARSTGAPRLERASGAAAVLALAPSTTFQLPPLDGYSLSGLAQLARDIPTHSLHTGDDPRAAAELVRELLVSGG